MAKKKKEEMPAGPVEEQAEELVDELVDEEAAGAGEATQIEPKAMPPVKRFRPAHGEKIMARPRPTPAGEPDLLIIYPERQRRAKLRYMPQGWATYKYNTYLRGLHRDGDLEVKPLEEKNGQGA